ncbi:hypothetical protein Tco_0424223 [Tanacetum coccineum]
MESIHPNVADLLGTGAKYQDELDKESDEKEVLAAGEDMDEDPQVAEEAFIKEYYDENVAHRDQTDKLVETTMRTINRTAPRINKRKGITTDSNEDPSKKPVPASTIVRPDPDEEVKVPYMINRKICYFTDTKMHAYLDKEEKLRKPAEEARLLAISKPEVIKVVQEEAEKIGLDPKKIASTKAGEKFKKAQDAEHQKKKAYGTEPEVKVPGLECHRSLPEGVSFVNNMVIEEPAYGIFFTDVFGDQAFQRWNDIHKLRKLIADYPDQEKLKSKRVKLEALGYQID